GSAPAIIAGDQRAVAAGEQHRRGSHGGPETERLAAGVVADVAYTPVAEQVGGDTMVQVGPPLAYREFVNRRHFEVVGDVELANRLLKSAVVLIHRATATPVRVGIGK